LPIHELLFDQLGENIEWFFKERMNQSVFAYFKGIKREELELGFSKNR